MDVLSLIIIIPWELVASIVSYECLTDLSYLLQLAQSGSDASEPQVIPLANAQSNVASLEQQQYSHHYTRSATTRK